MRPSHWMIAPYVTGAVPRPGPVFPGCRKGEMINRRRPESNRRAGAVPSPAGAAPSASVFSGRRTARAFFRSLSPPAGSAPAPRLADARRIAVMPPAPTLAACCPAEREVTMDRPGKLSARGGGSPGTRTRWRRRTASVHRRDPCSRGGSAPRVCLSLLFFFDVPQVVDLRLRFVELLGHGA